MAVGDIYEIRDVQSLLSQHVENVHFYRQALDFVTTNPTNSQSLAEAWIEQSLPTIAAIQTADVLHTNVLVRNLYDESDAYDASVSVSGNVSGGTATDQITSPFDAWAFQLDGDNPAVKNGQKRIAGVNEGWVLDGAVDPDSGAEFDLGAAAAQLSAAIQIGTIITDPVFVPVVVKRVRTGSPGAYEYRLPASSGEGVWSVVVVALFKLFITSQVSRKIGVGI